MLVCGRKTDGVAFRVKPRDHPTIQISKLRVAGNLVSDGVWGAD